MRKYIFVILSLIVIPFIVFAGSFGDFQHDIYTTALYYFEGNADDETGTHDGTVDGATLTNFGRFGQAYSFDGSNDSISISDHTDFTVDTSEEYTWEFWLKPSALGSWHTLFSMDRGTTTAQSILCYIGDGWFSSIDTISIRFFDTSDTGKILTFDADNFALTIGEWYYIVITYDGGLSLTSRVNIYINGENLTDGRDSGGGFDIGDIDPLYISLGKNTIWANEMFNGVIDSFQFSTVAKTALEIQAYYRQSKGIIIE